MTSLNPAPAGKLTPLLEARGVTMKFGGLTAVDHVDLVLNEVEFVGLT